MYRLIFETGLRKGQTYDADNTPIVDIGRDPSCKIMLEEPGVSRRNTIIQQMEDGIYISDLSSTNGTYVNNTKITKEHLLKTGDRVEIGSVKFIFQLSPPVKPGQRRRRGKLFFIAVGSIIGIILIELMALGIIALRSKIAKTKEPPSVVAETPSTPSAPTPSATTTPPPAPVVSQLEDTQKQLDQKLQRIEDLAKEISEAKTESKTGVEALDEELKALRKDIDGLKKRIEELAVKPAPPAAAPTTPPVPAPAASSDPILDRAKQMIREADLAKMGGEFDKAIRTLQGATILAPNYAPTYKALAEVYEMKGYTDAAKTTWQKIVAMGSAAGSAYDEANQHLQDLAQREAAKKLPELKPLEKPTLPGATPPKAELPRQLKIVDMQKVDHSGERDVDERYEVKFAIFAKTGEKFVATEEVRIEVKFYDKLDTGEIVETNAETTQNFNMPQVWESFDRKLFTATYRAAKGLRKKEMEETGKKRKSYGYIVRVHYRGKLQDEKSDPDKLLTLMSPQASNKE